MKWIGLTGSIGAGKSTVADLLRKSGYPVIDADSVAHEGLKPGTQTYVEIVNKFGRGILLADGQVHRRELGRLVFADPSLKQWLENVLHPMVQAQVSALRKKLQIQGCKMAFYEVPLLFEKGLQTQFDRVVVVWVSEKIQKQRLLARNAWSESEIQQRISSQWPIAEKLKLADYEINNDGSLAELEQDVTELISKLLN
jgi:dephospho-CoA kinase